MEDQQEYEKDILCALDAWPMILFFCVYFFSFVFGLAYYDRPDVAKMHEIIGAVCCVCFAAIVADTEFISEYRSILFKYKWPVALGCAVISAGLFVASYETGRWGWWAYSFIPLAIVAYRMRYDMN